MWGEEGDIKKNVGQFKCTTLKGDDMVVDR